MKTREYTPLLLAALFVGAVLLAPELAPGLLIIMVLGGIAYGMYRYRTDLRAADAWAARWPDLSHLDAANTRPDSGVWLITAPFGYGAWSLYAPGTARDERGYLTGAPFAILPVSDVATDDDDGMERLPQWAGPWIEQVTGGTVRFLLVGWSAPYGQGGHELSGYVHVTPSADRQTTNPVVD